MAFNTANLSIDDVFTTSRGSKIARIKDGDNNCEYIPSSKLRVPFEPSTFDKNPDATRLNLQLSIDDPAMQQELKKFDEWIIEYIAEHSERLLKRQMTKDKVRAGFTSSIKEKEGYSPLLKTKLDLDGRNAVCCWDKNGAIDIPKDWRGYIEARLCFSHLWLMGAQFGVVVRLTDAKFVEESVPERKNPFNK